MVLVTHITYNKIITNIHHHMVKQDRVVLLRTIPPIVEDVVVNQQILIGKIMEHTNVMVMTNITNKLTITIVLHHS